MNAGKNYSVREFYKWTIKDIQKILLFASIPTILFLLDIKWATLPLALVSIIGVATSFILGFRNSATYDRTWEARKIWGGIVNTSRTFTMLLNDNIKSKGDMSPEELAAVKKELGYRHFAWLTALRHQLRQHKAWEIMSNHEATNPDDLIYSVTEWNTSMEKELQRYLSDEEMQILLSKKNKASYLLSKQSSQLTDLLRSGNIDLFHQIEMQNRIAELYDHQGKSERIKNFPYPLQYSSISKYFVLLFAFMVPFGLIGEFDKVAKTVNETYYLWFILFNIPASAIVMWIFWILEKVGQASGNPFEGGPGDIPITDMSLNIENDCRDILGLERIDIPQPKSKILM